MAAKKGRKKAKKGHKKGHKKAARHSTAKRGAAKRHTLKPGMIVKHKPSKKSLASNKVKVVGYKLGKRKAGKKGKR